MERKNETWKDLVRQQVATGKYWKKIHGKEFKSQSFLMRSDVVHIAQKAQADAYENVFSELDLTEEQSAKLHQMIKAHWENAPKDSAIGMSFNGEIL